MKTPAILLLLLSFSVPGFEGSSLVHPYQQAEIPTVDFCEMVKHPGLYFDRTIRITATFQFGDEGSNVFDVRCVQSYDDQIGVYPVTPEKQARSFQKDFLILHEGRFGEHPRVTMTGILRNISRRDFHWYRHRFDIIGFEKMGRDPAQEIISYDGTLQPGFTYRATVRADRDFGLVFESPLRSPAHQAVRLEWTNLKKFPELQRMRKTDQRQIVFRAISDEVRQMSPQRWNRTVSLEILLVE